MSIILSTNIHNVFLHFQKLLRIIVNWAVEYERLTNSMNCKFRLSFAKSKNKAVFPCVPLWSSTYRLRSLRHRRHLTAWNVFYIFGGHIKLLPRAQLPPACHVQNIRGLRLRAEVNPIVAKILISSRWRKRPGWPCRASSAKYWTSSAWGPSGCWPPTHSSQWNPSTRSTKRSAPTASRASGAPRKWSCGSFAPPAAKRPWGPSSERIPRKLTEVRYLPRSRPGTARSWG